MSHSELNMAIIWCTPALGKLNALNKEMLVTTGVATVAVSEGIAAAVGAAVSAVPAIPDANDRCEKGSVGQDIDGTQSVRGQVVSSYSETNAHVSGVAEPSTSYNIMKDYAGDEGVVLTNQDVESEDEEFESETADFHLDNDMYSLEEISLEDCKPASESSAYLKLYKKNE